MLAVFAHPDDETVLAGGLLAFLSKIGYQVSYLICTRGEGGETGDPPVCSQKDLGLVREKELRNAVKTLGGQYLKILTYIDPLVGENNQLFSFTDDLESVINSINEELVSRQINIVISHGSNGEYGHPGHLTVYQAVQKAVSRFSHPLYWYTIQANHDKAMKPWLMNKNDQADWIFNAEVVKDEKLAAIETHKSQHALFKRRKTKELGREIELSEIMNHEEAYCLKNKNGFDPIFADLEKYGVVKIP